jgi:hypothetical protein
MTASIFDKPSLSARETRQTATFPFVSLSAGPGRVPIEVSLVSRLGHGAGDKLFFEAAARQVRHHRFVDELDEPSAKLGNTDFPAGDATALYTFGVGHRGHPFHRHAGHRVFTAVSGSGGAQLRFSNATPADIDRDPQSFVRALHYVNVPPDCLFTVRFSGTTWHQFAPLTPGQKHPAFFALSTHTNELGGNLSDATRQRVLSGEGDIPSLTELLPQSVARLLVESQPPPGVVPITELSLHDRPGGLLETVCRRYRSFAGNLQRWRFLLGTRPGYVSVVQCRRVAQAHVLAHDSLLKGELRDRTIHHEDAFTLTVRPTPTANRSAVDWLAATLDGFLDNRPTVVSRMMSLRNVLVCPFGLRTSPLGCPVSSLLSASSDAIFHHRFPVHAHALSADGRTAQVILGADDKHLVFRSCVAVRVLDDGAVEFSLSDRVACTTLFGRAYMAAIARTHRRVIAPAMLRHAVEAALVA